MTTSPPKKKWFKRPMIPLWKESLGKLLKLYERKKAQYRWFFPLLFLFFVLLNVFFYWVAIYSTHSQYMHGWLARTHRDQIIFMTLPIGILGGIFDFLSFFVTIWVVRQALKAKTAFSYVAHLSVDLVIAIIATFWVLWVVTISGQMYNWLFDGSETLAARKQLYETRALSAAKDPVGSWRMIVFGFLLGFSAMFPTVTHLYTSVISFFRAMRPEKESVVENVD